MKRIELDNLQWLLYNHGMSIEYGNTVVGVDYLAVEDEGVDLVIYDVEGLEFDNERVYNYEQLVKYCNENGFDEENFEIDRVTLIRSDDFTI